MIDLVVIRGAGSKQGDPIVDSLITSTGAALERGRVEIDLASINRENTVTIPFRAGLRPGLVIRVVDALLGAAWNGIVTDCDLVVEGPVLYATLTLVRSA